VLLDHSGQQCASVAEFLFQLLGYLVEELAQRLAADACLPLILARARVKALAISAQPRERNAGFADRGRSRLDLRI
jgi:hypothetical protein